MTGGVDGGQEIGDVINSGTITSAQFTIQASARSERVVDTGTIEGLWAIVASDLGSVANNGTIIGTQYAIRDFGGDTDLTLLAGSQMTGIVALGGGMNTR